MSWSALRFNREIVVRTATLLLRIIAAVLFLMTALTGPPGCGREEKKTEIDLNGHSIVWAAYADRDERLKGQFDLTVACLQENRMNTRPGYAFVVVVSGSFRCNGVLARGCAELNGKSIYMDREYLYTSVFAHEVVHWETGMGNEFHDSAQFTVCIPAEEEQ